MSPPGPPAPLTPPIVSPSALRCWLGFAAFYVASFATLAVYMQFFPAWLRQAGGLGEGQVAFVLAALTVARTLAGPFWSHRVDRRGSARPLLIGLSVASVGAFALFGVSHELVFAACASFVFGTVYSPMFPIVDAAAMRTAHERGFAFGRVRMAGSVAYLVVVLAMGPCLDAFGIGAVFPVLLAGTVVMAAAAVTLPRDEVSGARPPPSPWWELLRSRPVVLLLIASALIQGSHATYYNLSTIHWLDHGISKTVASLVWAEGILAEIALFFVARATAERLRPTTLLMVGGAAAIVRWSIVGLSTSVPVLLATGWLHGLTFGCTYLGALRALERRVPLHQRATAQGLLGAASSGVGMAVCGVVGGAVYDRWEGLAFLTMAAFAGAGVGLAFCLRRMADRNSAPPSTTAPSKPA